MGNSKKFDSQEQYWEDYHKEQLPPADPKETVRYQYDDNAAYWINYYEDKIGYALAEVEAHLKHAQERKKEQDFELKLYGGIFLGIFGFLPISLALPMSRVLPFVILGGVLVIIELFAIFTVIPVCIYKLINCLVSKLVNDKDSAIGNWLVQRYNVPRLTGEIQACQIYVGRYKGHLTNIASWREMLEQGSFDMDIEEIKSRMEKVNLDPQIETASKNHYRLKRLINRITIVTATVIFTIILCLIVKGYMSYYNWFLSFWKSV
ncbi:MAG: hypothetical protein IJ429_06100 [Lachnospiraceae bacterium]|nr:hypothetical protein [Lachnospiraceae bacterium]